MAAEIASSESPLSVVAQIESQSCYKCHGSGKHKWKEGEDCTACKGAGCIPRTRKTKKRSRAVKEFAGYLAPGPFPFAEHAQRGEAAAPSSSVNTFDEGETELCFLVGHWKIFQSTQTHRYSTDDVVTAWAAQRLRLAPGPPGTIPGALHCMAAITNQHVYTHGALRILDIGCGIGSVLLMNAWCHPTAVCVGLEAQAARAAQALRSARYNVGDALVSDSAAWLADGAVSAPVPRLSIVHGDLRDGAALPTGAQFDLVTGTPPYFDPQVIPQTTINETNACLSEIRGGIEVYCEAAARWLKPGGHFVVCNTTIHRARSHKAATDSGFEVLRCVDIVPRDGKPVLFMVLVCRKPGGTVGAAAAAAFSDTTPVSVNHHTDASHPSAKRPRTGSGSATEAPPSTPCTAGDAAAAGESSSPYITPDWALDPASVPDGAAILRTVAQCPPSVAHLYCVEGTVDTGGVVDDIGECSTVPPTGDKAGNTPGAVLERICVRDSAGVRTAAYKRLLWQMGKPG